METMTITRALAELKLLNSRIEKTTEQAKFVDVTRMRDKGKALKTNVSIDEFNKNAEAYYTSIKDLINRRNSIKSAVLKSNSNTVVTIAEKEMTVVEVIDRKNSIYLEEFLLNKMRMEYTSRVTEIERAQVALDEQVEQMLLANLGKDTKVDENSYNNIAKPFIEANKYELVDPIKIADKIELMSVEIEDFKSNVDFVLSESNAKTEITIKC